MKKYGHFNAWTNFNMEGFDIVVGVKMRIMERFENVNIK